MFVEVIGYENDKPFFLNCEIIKSFIDEKDGDYFSFVRITLINGESLNIKGTSAQLLAKIDSVQHIYVK